MTEDYIRAQGEKVDPTKWSDYPSNLSAKKSRHTRATAQSK